MPSSVPSMAVKKKHSVVPPSLGPLSTSTMESQGKLDGPKRLAEKDSNNKPNTQTKKIACFPFVNKSAQSSNTSPRNTAGSNGLNVDERLRLARERREEHDKELVSREMSLLQRQERARRYYESQLEERKKRLVEQRLREEGRRNAVEEKRRQKLKEEKERNEFAVRKTLEKSQKAQQKAHQKLTQNSRGRNNVPRRLPLTAWEKNLVSRLLTPTCSYLARSKSAGCQSGEEVSCHSMTTTTNNTTTAIAPAAAAITHKPQHHSPAPAQHRTSTSPRTPVSPRTSVSPRPSVFPKTSVSPSPTNGNHRSINLAQIKTARNAEVKKKIITKARPPHAPAAVTRVKPVANKQSRTASPSPERTVRRPSRHSAQVQPDLPSVPEEDPPACSAAGNSRPTRTEAEGPQQEDRPPETPCSDPPDAQADTNTRTEGDGSSSQVSPPAPSSPPALPTPPPPPGSMNRPLGGTTDPEEASRILAEKRREARLRKEREEQEQLQREEAERRAREELEQRRAEERARLQAEAQRLVEEKTRREEEEKRQAEEERAKAAKEAALLQKQREEEQTKEKEKAQQIMHERELLAQKEEAARQARKKRLEEIMKRTRRTDPADTKSSPVKLVPNDAKPKENTEPAQNGTIEEAARLPVGTKPSQLNGVEDMVPVVAFKERRSLRTLTGLEEIQTHHRAEVIS